MNTPANLINFGSFNQVRRLSAPTITTISLNIEALKEDIISELSKANDCEHTLPTTDSPRQKSAHAKN